MKRKIVAIISLVLAAIMICFTPPHTLALQTESYYTISDVMGLYQENVVQTIENGYTVSTVTITDPIVLEGLVNAGVVPLGDNGELPSTVTIYGYTVTDSQSVLMDAGIDDDLLTVSGFEPVIIEDLNIVTSNQRTYEADTYFAEDAVCDGDTLVSTYTVSGTSGWTTSMGSSVEVSGSVVTILEVKGAVSRELGATIGASITKTKEHTTKAPEGKLRRVRAFLMYSAFDYVAKYGLISICLGEAWKPCGIFFAHADYDYDPSDYFG